ELENAPIVLNTRPSITLKLPPLDVRPLSASKWDEGPLSRMLALLVVTPAETKVIVEPSSTSYWPPVSVPLERFAGAPEIHPPFVARNRQLFVTPLETKIMF